MTPLRPRPGLSRRSLLASAAAALAISAVWTGSTRTALASEPRYRRGVNLAGAEFGPLNWIAQGDPTLPGVYGQHYLYPGPESLDYYARKGFTLVRLPLRWERLQRSLGGPLDRQELRRLYGFLAAASQRGLDVIVDIHNYGRYYDRLIGTPDVTYAHFSDLWRRLARQLRDEPAVWAFSIMNEPAETEGRWPDAAQAAVDAIRDEGVDRLILVPGDEWSDAFEWPDVNADFSVTDPADNFMYDAHVYFDPDRTGTYRKRYRSSTAHPDVGVDRVRGFVEWLRDRGARGFVSEYGVPGDDPRWLEALDRFLTYLDAEEIGGCYWAGGPLWQDYPLSIEPRDQHDRPQMAVLTRHLDGG
ncbi:MAG: glycoside hydrolase family 5 protein [Chloroflexota bacterium]